MPEICMDCLRPLLSVSDVSPSFPASRLTTSPYSSMPQPWMCWSWAAEFRSVRPRASIMLRVTWRTASGLSTRSAKPNPKPGVTRDWSSRRCPMPKVRAKTLPPTGTSSAAAAVLFSTPVSL